MRYAVFFLFEKDFLTYFLKKNCGQILKFQTKS